MSSRHCNSEAENVVDWLLSEIWRMVPQEHVIQH